MSPATSPVLVEQSPPVDRSWCRFVAVLCFLEFYCRFVCHGTALWRDLVAYKGSLAIWDQWSEVGSALFIVRAFCLYLCGRVLWTGRGRLSRYVYWAMFASVLEIIVSTLGTMNNEPQYTYAFTWPPSVTVTRGIPALQALANNIEHLPWIGLLLALVWGRHWWRGKFQIYAGSWLLPATVWVLWWILLCLRPWRSYFPHDLIFGLPHVGFLLFPMFSWSAANRWVEVAAGVIALISAIASIIGLYRGWRFVLAAIVVVLLCEISGHDAGYQITALVDTAINGMLASCPYPVINPVPWPWILLNDASGNDVLIYMPAALGPWVLIAVYAWRVPIRRAIGEPSLPYPQFLCGQCRYNLHGLHGHARCPECGAELAWDGATAT